MGARTARWPGVALAALLALGRGAVPEARAEEPVVVLVNATNPVTSLSTSELRKALTGGTKQWPHGAVVQVGITATESAELLFLSARVDMTPRELVRRIQEQVFKGEMRRPIVLRSSGECVGLARSNSGALCVATRPATLPSDVKIVTLRGDR